MTSNANFDSLEAMWKFMATLSATSSDEEIRKVISFYEADAVVYLNGMNNPPSTTHEELVSKTKTLVGYWALVKRRVTVHLAGENGTKFVNAMDNTLKILGQEVQFPECEVVTFSSNGLIKEYLLFADPTPVMAIFAKANNASS